MGSGNLKKLPIIRKSIAFLAIIILVMIFVNPPLVSLGEWYRIYKTDSRTLDLSSLGLTQRDVKKLRYFKNIESLYLNGNSLYCLNFLEEMPHIKDLAIGTGLYSINDPPIEVDFSPLYKVNLESFKGVGLHYNGFDDISALTQMNNLKKVELCCMNLSREMINEVSMLYQIDTLSLFCSDIEDYSPLSSLTQLKCLTLFGTDIQDDDTDFIKNLVELESIDISETSISDFDFLYSLEKLKEVKASGEQLSNDDLFELKNRGIEVILC